MKIKKVGWFLRTILPKNVEAITLWPFAIYYTTPEISRDTQQHEEDHWWDMKKLWGIGFYVAYFFEWIFKGYKNISFEKKARDAEKKD